MNTRTHKRADHCQEKPPLQRKWVEHGPFLHAEDEAIQPDEPWGSDLLDGMLDDDTPPEDFFDFFN
jgi:hypothetical protein